jgi:hypothetical protein
MNTMLKDIGLSHDKKRKEEEEEEEKEENISRF